VSAPRNVERIAWLTAALLNGGDDDAAVVGACAETFGCSRQTARRELRAVREALQADEDRALRARLLRGAA
jgi:hypothetical protein